MSQVIANALVTVSFYTLVGVGFSFVYMATRFFDFSYAALITVGAYGAVAAGVWLGAPLMIAIAAGMVCSFALGCAIEATVYRRMRRNNASSSVLLLASLGVYLAIIAAVSIVFGSGSRALVPGGAWPTIEAFNVRVALPHFIVMAAALSAAVSATLILHKSEFGIRLRAIGENPDLSFAKGFDVDRDTLTAVAVGATVAGIAGALLAIDQGVYPAMGFRVLLGGIVSMIIGGIGSVRGVVFGALLLGGLEHAVAWWISSAWQDVVVFGALVFFLFVRPYGIFGVSSRRSAV
ncbi:MAG: branched-chain amino acid ABC transporter permease [Rhodospirillales bacterium]|nr:branched-chain amino acid ABC transporter permease [Rhodospirillales bacterium]